MSQFVENGGPSDSKGASFSNMAVETDLDKIYKAFTSTNPVVDWNEHTAVEVKDFTD